MSGALIPGSLPDRGERTAQGTREEPSPPPAKERAIDPAQEPATPPAPDLIRPLPPLVRSRDSAPAAPRPTTPPASGSAGPAAPYPRPGAALDPTTAPGPALPRSQAGAYLSPRMTAIFGGIFGLATVTSIIALLIQVVPPRDERSIVAQSANVEVSTTPTATPREVKKPKRTPIPGPWRIRELEKDPTVTLASAAMERRSFIDALADKGVPKSQAYRIMKAFDGLRKFDKTGRKDRFTVAMDRASQRVRAFEYEITSTEIYQAREGNDGLLLGARLDMKVAENEVTGAFYVGSDLTASYESGGLEDGVLAAIDEALSGRLSTESFDEGGTVRLIAMEETALGLFAKYKRITALEYRPPDPAAKPVRIYYFVGQEAKGYFDERGRQPYGGGWRSPCPGAPVTSKFNPKRLHPVLKKIMPHNGTDFGADSGTPIYSAYRGVVAFVGMAGPSGNLVTINHPNGIETGYAHMSRFAPGIKVGDKIGTHELVGYVGTTGRSTGPHLHFSAKKDGKFFDAETLQLDGERVMPAVDRPAFAAVKEELDKRLDAIPLPEPPPEKPKAVAASGAAGAAGASSAASGPGSAGSAGAAPAASGSSDPGIHPSQFVEDDSEGDEDEGGEMIAGAALGNPPASGAAPQGSGPSGQAPSGAPKTDPAEEEDEGEGN
jgi:murein DD-endopeptidase MepM/ murein hydrolase activator NlpD